MRTFWNVALHRMLPGLAVSLLAGSLAFGQAPPGGAAVPAQGLQPLAGAAHGGQENPPLTLAARTRRGRSRVPRFASPVR